MTDPENGDLYYLQRNATRSYRGGGLNTKDPLRVTVFVGFQSPSPEWRRNLGFRCFLTVCTPRFNQG